MYGEYINIVCMYGECEYGEYINVCMSISYGGYSNV